MRTGFKDRCRIKNALAVGDDLIALRDRDEYACAAAFTLQLYEKERPIDCCWPLNCPIMEGFAFPHPATLHADCLGCRKWPIL